MATRAKPAATACRAARHARARTRTARTNTARTHAHSTHARTLKHIHTTTFAPTRTRLRPFWPPIHLAIGKGLWVEVRRSLTQMAEDAATLPTIRRRSTPRCDAAHHSATQHTTLRRRSRRSRGWWRTACHTRRSRSHRCTSRSRCVTRLRRVQAAPPTVSPVPVQMWQG